MLYRSGHQVGSHLVAQHSAAGSSEAACKAPEEGWLPRSECLSAGGHVACWQSSSGCCLLSLHPLLCTPAKLQLLRILRHVADAAGPKGLLQPLQADQVHGTIGEPRSGSPKMPAITINGFLTLSRTAQQ